jgi:hypothetical protein
MKSDKKTYSKLISVLTLVYLNFFFFAPYIHFHSEEENFLEGKPVLHSHISWQSETDQEGLYSSDSHGHDHLQNVDYFSIVFPKQNLLSSADIIFFQTTPSLINNKEEKTSKDGITRSIFKTSWEKYVQTASNLPPPLI